MEPISRTSSSFCATVEEMKLDIQAYIMNYQKFLKLEFICKFNEFKNNKNLILYYEFYYLELNNIKFHYNFNKILI